MSTTAGVFSETQLVAIQAKADQVWLDRAQKEDYVGQVNVVKAIIAQMTATFGRFLTGAKDRSVEISWVNACDIAATSVTNCVFPTTELSTNADEKVLSQTQQTGFFVKEYDFLDNTYDMEEAVAKGLLQSTKVLDEWWAAAAMVSLNAAKGVNEVAAGKGVVAGTDTYVLPAYWNADLMAYFNRVATINRIVNPYLISGNNLYESVWNAAFETGQSGDQAKQPKFGTLPIYFDLFNVDVANTPDLVTYLIGRGAFAYITKAYYGATPITYMDQKRYSIPSMNLPGVRYDVHYTNECDTDNDFMTHSFKVKTLGDIFLNPVGCTPTRTNDLSFICGEAPA
jgi:hypothetical protein